jgi:glycosyltransferase involved in cell wall biosynthesis
MELSVVILAMTTTEALFKMTSNCISSLIASENVIDREIIVIESNKNYLNSNFVYPEFVKVIIPEADFNFHKFLNIGIKASKGDYIALCNNDMIYLKNKSIYDSNFGNPILLSKKI